MIKKQSFSSIGLAILLLLTSFGTELSAQRRKSRTAQVNASIDPSLFEDLTYRHIGPFRGGRSAAVSGVTGNNDLYYMGATGGGVWKTDDAGNSWTNISDGFFGGSIGSIDVAQSDPNIIFVGGGEVTVRGNVSYGYGIWKSYDAGKSWEYSGLKEGQNIPRIRIHPKNPDLVYAAVLGHVFGPNKERGIYRSKDGGKSWENILYVNEQSGAVDLVLDPSNPRIMYATTWRMIRTPYSLESGGEGSLIWKSTDGGDTWTNLSEKPGFPKGLLGIMGVSVSPVNPELVWAMVEAKDGGLFRSENGGESWRRVNSDRSLRQRAWYYTRVYADTKNEDMVYVLNVGFHRSKDGGRTFERIRTPHGDHHDLWISALDNQVMVIADDGGGQVTKDGGENWSTYNNQPTAQFYRVTTDNHFPYRIYAAQQDNSTVRIVHRSDSRRGIGDSDWESTAGGESGHIAPDPNDPEIVYGGSYGGYLVRVNHRTGEYRSVDVWPDNPMGWGAKELKYRFQWNFPIFFSNHNPRKLYTAANVLFETNNEGQTWEVISPDLTRNDKSRMESSGGPITKDNTSIEYYGTIFAATESLHEPGVIWTGSDDGLIHITKDGGETWKNVTPPASIFPELTMVNSIEPHPFEKGGLYVAATAYKLDDFRPYLYKTIDYGKSWTRITTGIDPTHFTRVVRADPNTPGMLYAGTESGIYISFDDGASWSSFQLNLPVVPITDLAIKENDLIVATQGRSLWVMDNLTQLHQLTTDMITKEVHLFDPRPAYRMPGGGGGRGTGENPPAGPVISYWLKGDPEGRKIDLEIMEEDGASIMRFSNHASSSEIGANQALAKLQVKEGLNQFAWNMRYPGSTRFDGLIMWGGSTSGPSAIPGNYKTRLTVDGVEMETGFTILPDPRKSASVADLKAQFDFLIEVGDKLTETHNAIIDIRKIKAQMNTLNSKTNGEKMALLKEKIKETLGALDRVEKALYQTQNRSGQDPLNYPIRLNNKLAALGGSVSMGDNRPTDQSFKVKDYLVGLIDRELETFKGIKETDIPAINKMALELEVEAIK